MRQKFTMTEEQHAAIAAGFNSIPGSILGGGKPIGPEAEANKAWRVLGETLGFNYLTVQPVEGESDYNFTAEVDMPQGVKASSFKEGEWVTYIPRHVRKDYKFPEQLEEARKHKDNEVGVVTSTNDPASIVFVRFGKDVNSKACYPEDVFKVPADFKPPVDPDTVDRTGVTLDDKATGAATARTGPADPGA
jgi:hypothetical protein